jgi:hypothetical protein
MSEEPLHYPKTPGGAHRLGAQVPVLVLYEAGSYLRLIDSCITQLGAQGRSRTCNESKGQGEEVMRRQERLMLTRKGAAKPSTSQVTLIRADAMEVARRRSGFEKLAALASLAGLCVR